MTTLALSVLINSTPRLLARLLDYWTAFLNGIEEARAMATLYQDLAGMSDRELAARGLKRQDIPRAVMRSTEPDRRGPDRHAHGLASADFALCKLERLCYSRAPARVAWSPVAQR